MAVVHPQHFGLYLHHPGMKRGWLTATEAHTKKKEKKNEEDDVWRASTLPSVFVNWMHSECDCEKDPKLA
jgi:hypothetical protein